MKLNEDWVKREIKKRLSKYEHLHWWMPSANMYGVSGQHDFMICQYGVFWTIEAKYGTNTPTDNQINFARDIRKAGGFCLMVNERNLEEVDRVATYIARVVGTVEEDIGHDFNQWRKNASTK